MVNFTRGLSQIYLEACPFIIRMGTNYFVWIECSVDV